MRLPSFQFGRSPLELSGLGGHAHLIASDGRACGMYLALYLGPFVLMASWSWRRVLKGPAPAGIANSKSASARFDTVGTRS